MGISIWQLLLILGMVILIFGTNKFRTIGSDLGGAIKSFKLAINNTSTRDTEFSETDPASEQNNHSHKG